MNISVVKRSGPLIDLIRMITNFFKRRKKYIQIPATTSLNYVNSNFKKTEIDIGKVEKQDVVSVKELLEYGVIDIKDLTLEELDEINSLYIKENEAKVKGD